MNIQNINNDIEVDEECITAYDQRGRSTAFRQPKGVGAGARVTIRAIINGKSVRRAGYLHRAGRKNLHQYVLKSTK